MTEQATAIRQYLIVTGNYWAFTLTDGALRMLVVLYFHQLGYSPLEVASLFLFYEFFGIVTNLVGGWLGARIGLNRTMNLGLSLQIAALAMLCINPEWLTVVWVMAAQAMSGIAKDLNKMSAKTSVKQLVKQGQNSALFRWVAVLTGSKNALKGVGFFLGGVLLTAFGFQLAILIMLAGLAIVLIFSLISLKQDLGKASTKPKFSEIFSSSRSVNQLSAARFFLFGARDIWFVVALPVYMSTELGWSHWQIGSYLASWIIGYGFIQAGCPWLLKRWHGYERNAAIVAAALLAIVPASIGATLAYQPEQILLIGLVVFAAIFAINSALHSYLIVYYAKADGASMDVGFYYMANAGGRLAGTVLSGWVYQQYGLTACLWISALMVVTAFLLTLPLSELRHSR